MELLTELESMAFIVQQNDDRQFEDLFHNHPKPGLYDSEEEPQDQLSRAAYLLKLEGPLSDMSQVQELTGLLHPPQIVEGTDSASRKASFCAIKGTTKKAITRALRNTPFTPTRASTVHRAKMHTWGGKYKALVDGSESEYVNGWAYQIASEEHEEQLRYYETDQYEVVRCNILMNETEVIQGLTFGFIGNAIKR